MNDLQEQFLRLRIASSSEREQLLREAEPQRRALLVRMLEADQSEVAGSLREMQSQRLEVVPIAFPEGLPDRYQRTHAPPRVGGMGVVHKVWDRQLERHVALKVAHPQLLEDPVYEALFLREPLMPSRLQHPGIIPIYDQSSTGDGTPYYTMRFVSDRTLADLIDRGDERFTSIDALLRVCDAIAFAHSRGIVHRDLKPSNVSIDSFGSVTILDWGIAIAFEDHDDVRTSAMLSDVQREAALRLETRSYAPASGIIDPSGDLYSLGVILAQIVLEERSPDVALERLASDAAADLDPTSVRLLELCRMATSEASEARRDHFRDVSAFAGAVRRWQIPEIAVLRIEVESAGRLTPKAALERLDDIQGRMGGLETRGDAYTELDDAIRALRVRFRSALGRRRLLVAAGVLLPLVIGSALWIRNAERRREASEARNAQIRRLQDAPLVRRLLSDAETLWPAAVDAPARMEAWIDTARGVLDRRRAHEQALAEYVRKTSPPVGTATVPDDVAWMRADLEDLDAYARRPGTNDFRGGIPLRQRLVREQLEAAMTQVREEGVPVRPSAPVEFMVLSELVAGLRAIGDPGGLLDRMTARRAALPDDPIADLDSAVWDSVSEQLRTKDARSFVGFRPHPLLVPLGADPHSGLQEFFVRGTGSIPQRGADRSLVRERDFGVVLVLVPAGHFVRGSISDYETLAGTQPAPGDERPLGIISVSPFYLSKYELTQAQWGRMTEGGRPSHERAGRFRPGFPEGSDRSTIDIDDPVESVSWTLATKVLRRFGLRLPSEAEWEYAAWGGQCTPDLSHGASQPALRAFLESRYKLAPGFWRYLKPGDDPARYANFADAFFARNSPHDMEVADRYDDGHHFHAWVGAFEPNDYGLHDMHGNVREWCRDVHDTIYYHYSRLVNPPGSTANFDAPERVTKGGSWIDLPRELQISDRMGSHRDRPNRYVGVRPAMSLRE